MRSGSARQIAPYIREMSYKELLDVKNRLELEAQFRDLVVKEASAANPKTQVAMNRVKRATDYANTGMDAYNAFTRVYNAFSKDKKLPTIQTPQEKKKKKKNKKS